MLGDFKSDVVLIHSPKEKPVVRELEARLKRDGVCVWLDEEQLPSPAGAGGRGTNADAIPAKIEERLEHSRVLVLCVLANAFESDWAQLEVGTYGMGNWPFRAPLNRERRFIPVRLDAVHIKRSTPRFYAFKP